MNTSSTNCFTYGTLMCTDIMRRVAGVEPGSAAAQLQGFRRHALRGQCYPAIIADTSGTVSGLVYTDVSDEVLLRLNRYEGALYQRISVSVTTHDQNALPAETYILKPAYRHLLAGVDWDFEKFLENNKADYLKMD